MSTDKSTSQITRRQLLQAAGGITFLALAPTADGAFAATFGQGRTSDLLPPLPIFTALPYLQPGTANSTLVEGKEAIVVAWQTNNLPAAFDLEYGPTTNLGQKADIHKQERLKPGRKEGQGVDVILNGHVHNYQRTRPMRFKPTDEANAKLLHSGHRLIPGAFTVDRKFDGKTVTKPDGIIHIVTGAGGNDLYDPECHEEPSHWTHVEDNNADYVARFISDRHSLTVVDMDRHALTFTQIDEWGRTIDSWHITKA